jgi:hypothetical protein
MKEDKESKKEKLTAAIDVLTQEIADLEVSIKENMAAVAQMQSDIATETGEREAEKAENTATIKDAQEAQTAVSQAIAVLEEFYKGTGMMEKEAWEFSQMHAHVRRVSAPAGETELPEPNPEMFESPYKGQEGGTGVVGMLKEISENFALMETNAKADETQQQDDFDTFLTDTKIAISEKEKDTEMKTARKGRQEEKLTSKQDDFKHNEKELEATLQYESDLQHACVDGDSTYEDRKAARTREIEALKEAQDILAKAFDEAPAEEGPPAETPP